MTGSRRRVGLRRGRAALLGAIAASAVMAFGVSSAQANSTPETFTFDDGALKLGGSGDALDIVGTTPVTWDTAFCGDTTGDCLGKSVGDFTVTPANFHVPAFTSEVTSLPGLFATVGLTPAGDVTGHYDQVTGVLTTDPQNYTSSINLSGALTLACSDGPISLALSTLKSSPFLGHAFTGLPPVSGVTVADWSTLPVPSGDPLCASLLSVFTNGPGGIALANGVAPTCSTCTTTSAGGTTSTPAPVTTLSKRQKCIKKAKKIKDKQKRKKALKKCKKKKKK